MTDVTGQNKVIGQEYFFSYPLYFFPHSFSSSSFFPRFHCLISIFCSQAKCLGKYSFESSPFSIAILNGTCPLRAPILFCGDIPAIKQLNYKLQTAVVHRHRCGLGGLAIAAMRAEITVAAMAPRAENSRQILQTL